MALGIYSKLWVIYCCDIQHLPRERWTFTYAALEDVLNGKQAGTCRDQGLLTMEREGPLFGRQRSKG